MADGSRNGKNVTEALENVKDAYDKYKNAQLAARKRRAQLEVAILNVPNVDETTLDRACDVVCTGTIEEVHRALTTVRKTEAEGVQFVKSRTDAGTLIHADEASHWDHLEDDFTVMRINHSEAYSMDGACTNQAESFFSRLRKMVGGQHHHVSAKYLDQYAAHSAWLEDHRRESNGTLVGRALKNILASPVSRNWAGYWQRAK